MSASTYPKLKVAAVQAAPVYLDLEKTVAKAVKFIEEAASNGAKLVAFPEAFIPGYPWFAFIGHPEYTRKWYHQLYKNALEIPSPAIQKISNAARDNDIFVSISGSEKDNGSLFLCQLWFDNKGNLIGKHRKLRASVAERLVWGDGCLMCWEHQVPLDLAAMNNQNEQIHVAAWPGYFDDEISSRYYAISTQTFVVMCSSIYSEEMKKMICETKEQREYFETFKSGHTCIYGPDGEPISELVPSETEGIAYADVDIARTIDFKYYIDPAGHYSNKSLSAVHNVSDTRPIKQVGNAPSQFIGFDELNSVEGTK
ncbi:Nitrilase, arylacetone-specific [Scheffersomyces xylosifermentans]|uniref:Nitrilase, arylacetone-specific n=1 Tax=Scheffersomyces xylosifermentans TaxID=1304137 RepID=UPI00315C4FC1